MGKGRGKGAKATDANVVVQPTASKAAIAALEKKAAWKPPKKIRDADLELLYQMEVNGEMFCVTDPELPDHPIVYASPKFLAFTGYTDKDIVGTNCRFLQGEETEPEDVADIRNALKTTEDTAVFLYNYKKDGTGFYNQFFMTPLRKKSLFSKEPKPAYFIGVQTECTSKEDKAAVGNNCRVLREKQHEIAV
ncbi:Blue-light photoreceptor [Porphyridium purpureum]|uniref:Blue-light photoreceptor n=1 Tax=Porphyridium purpureum TaxID=35688 RepID=A0A126X0I4_PORPP|nr:putative LOV domain-containing protein [Porphyridium cruentum]AML78316.1 putative LOV domain-containing protein [Porphyridium purpureum]KAA8496088.1 Blue-light photoreceptor [Porphyridium purpureum]|eukprot:POR2343..scf209_3